MRQSSTDIYYSIYLPSDFIASPQHPIQASLWRSVPGLRLTLRCVPNAYEFSDMRMSCIDVLFCGCTLSTAENMLQ